MLDQLLAQSDPVNAVLVIVIWRRLDSRLRTLRADLEAERPQPA